MSSRTYRREPRRADAGVALIEAALGIPVLLLFIMALVDLGMWTLNSNQATNAARDGARVGILHHETADIPGSDDAQRVLAGVRSHLDRAVTEDQVTISCVDPVGDPVDGGCAAAVPEHDRIRVEVAWSWRLITPIAGVVGSEDGAATGDATMEVVGRPLPPTPPAAGGGDDDDGDDDASSCTVDGLAVSQIAPNVKKNGSGAGELQEAMTVTWTPSAGCSNLQVAITGPGSVVTSTTCTCSDATEQTWTLADGTTVATTEGAASVSVLASDGSTLAERDFTFS